MNRTDNRIPTTLQEQASFQELLAGFLGTRKKIELPADGSRIFLAADHHMFHTNILQHCPERGRLFPTAEDMNDRLVDLHNQTVEDADIVIFAGDYLMKGRAGNPLFTNNDDRIASMGILTRRMKGKKYFIRGNHDKFPECDYLQAGFAAFGDYAVLAAPGVSAGVLPPADTSACVDAGHLPPQDVPVPIDTEALPAAGEELLLLHSPKDIVNLWFKAQKHVPLDDIPNGYAECKEDIEAIPGRYLCAHIHQMWRHLGPFVNVGLDVWGMRPVLLDQAALSFGEPSTVLVNIGS